MNEIVFEKAASKGRSRILQSLETIHVKKGIKSKQADNAHSPTVLERIRKHEFRCGQPAILGELDGTSHRVDRLKAIGNGQIPSVVRLAWETLSS
jgi:hypothetical protein